MYTFLFDFKEDKKLKQIRLDSKGNVLEKGEYYRDYDGRYVYNYKNPFNGKRVSLYAVSLDSLRDKEKKLREELQNSIEKYRNRNITLNDIFEDYVASRISWSKGTEANNVSMYNRHIKNSIGRLKLINIKKDTVRRFLKNVHNETGMYFSTLAGLLGLISNLFEYAIDMDFPVKNPCAGIYSEFSNKIPHNKGCRKALTRAQEKAFLNFIRNNSEFAAWEPMFVIFLHTGLRLGELIGLRWCDVDMMHRTININHALVRERKRTGEECQRLVVSAPKTNAGIRMIPMTDAVYNAFRGLQERKNVRTSTQIKIDGMTDFIFVNRIGNVYNGDDINNALKRIIKKYNNHGTYNYSKNADVEYLPDISVHVFRHTFCTRLCEIEHNVRVIQDIMGHNNIKTTLEIYNTVNTECKSTAMEKFEDVMNEMFYGE